MKAERTSRLEVPSQGAFEKLRGDTEKARALLREGGVPRLLGKLTRMWLYRRDVQLLLGFDLDCAGRSRTQSGKYRVKLLADAHDGERLRKHIPERIPVLRRWQARGVTVLGVLDGEDVVGMNAVTPGLYYEPLLRYRFEMPPGSWFQFAGWVAPQYRGSAVAATGVRALFALVAERGGTRIVNAIDEKNLPSLKLNLHLGFREIGEGLVFRRLLFLRWTRSFKYCEPRLEGLIARGRGKARALSEWRS